MKPHIAIPLITLGLLVADYGLVVAQGRGNQTPTIRQLAWVDRSGEVQGPIGPRMSSILDPSISPDGRRVAVRGRLTQGETLSDDKATRHEGESLIAATYLP